MRNLDFEPGMKFGKLTVIRSAGKNDKKERVWLCRCDCGNEKIIVGHRLKSGKVKSCGCLQFESGKACGKRHRKVEIWMPKVLPEGVQPRLIPYIPKDISQFGYDAWMFRNL